MYYMHYMHYMHYMYYYMYYYMYVYMYYMYYHYMYQYTGASSNSFAIDTGYQTRDTCGPTGLRSPHLLFNLHSTKTRLVSELFTCNCCLSKIHILTFYKDGVRCAAVGDMCQSFVHNCSIYCFTHTHKFYSAY
jgi:hypothetical protein